MVQPYNVMLFSKDKQQIIDTHSVDQFQVNYVMWTNPDSKGRILYDSIYMEL